MDKDSIDASLGLTFSLVVFRKYRESGVLQATVRNVPGVKGTGTAFLHLQNGDVVACYVEDRRGQQIPVHLQVLTRLDDERGPFEWAFHPQEERAENIAALSSNVPMEDLSTRFEQPPMMPSFPRSPFQASPAESNKVLHDGAIPVITNVLALDRLENWTLQQKQTFLAILRAIDGKRSVRDMKVALQLPPVMVEEALRLLLSWNTIALLS